MDYKSAGVDVVAGDSASTIMYEASRRTWKNREGLAGEIQSASDFFGAVRAVNVNSFNEAVLGMNFDGVGTKIEIAERLQDHSSIAKDLFAMVCDDASIRGAEPILFGSILDCNRVSVPAVRQLATGMIEAARIANVAVINGEVAELGNRVQGHGDIAYNWGGAVIWVARRERLLTGDSIRPGDSIIVVRENGFRSNGLSLVRRIFSSTCGLDWHTCAFNGDTLGTAVLEPSIIYTPLLVQLTGGYSFQPRASVSAAVNVTGGGIPGKLGRGLHGSGLGAELDNLFEPCPIMAHAQQIGKVPDDEAYRTWNMGQGLLLICRETDLVLKVASQLHLDARIAGVVTKKKGIRILSKGQHQSGTWLAFE